MALRPGQRLHRMGAGCIARTVRGLGELERALDELVLDGVRPLANTDGRHLAGHPEPGPLMAELDRHGATVLVHSLMPPGAELADPQLPALLVDLTVDALHAAGFLPGVLRRHGAVRSVLAYAGGVIPDLAWCLERAGSCLPTMPRNTPQGTAAR